MALTSVETFYQPENIDRVTELLQEHEDSAMIVAGGTFLHGLSARGLLYGVEALIDIRKLGLDYIRPVDDGIEIGAATRFLQLQESALLRDNAAFGAIRDALEYPPMQIMNSATIGGCVASSCPFFDLPTAFLALDARVLVHGREGGREVALREFFTGLFENALQADEFIVAVRIPGAAGGSASAFIKLETNANDLAILNVAASLQTDTSGLCRSATIFIGGGVGESVVRAPSAEAALAGNKLDATSIGQAAAVAKNDVEPLSDHRASAAYRSAMTAVLLERTLKRLQDRTG